MGWNESAIACLIIHAILSFTRPRKLGKVLGPDGMQRLVPGLIRVPDVSYFARGKLTRSQHGATPVAPLAGDLVVEVVSKSNTKAEIRASSPSISPPAAGLPGWSSPSLRPSGCTLPPVSSSFSAWTTGWTAGACCRDSGLRCEKCLKLEE